MSLSRAQSPFHFSTLASLTQVTGRKAKNLKELLLHLKEAPLSVTYHHTHRFLKQHHFLSPEPPNDFAYWVNRALQHERLAESLASIDTVQFTRVHDLRDQIVRTIENYLARNPSDRDAVPGDEFYFMQSISFVLATPYEAWDLEQFADCLKKVSIYSLYYHIFDAKLRLRQMNDFSFWLETSLEESALAASISHLDPYTQTLEGLRSRIIRLVERRIKEISPVKEAAHV